MNTLFELALVSATTGTGYFKLKKTIAKYGSGNFFLSWGGVLEDSFLKLVTKASGIRVFRVPRLYIEGDFEKVDSTSISTPLEAQRNCGKVALRIRTRNLKIRL